MRRFCVLALLILGIMMIVTGIAEAVVHPTMLPELHIVAASLIIIVIIHIITNRKAVMRYIEGN